MWCCWGYRLSLLLFKGRCARMLFGAQSCRLSWHACVGALEQPSWRRSTCFFAHLLVCASVTQLLGCLSCTASFMHTRGLAQAFAPHASLLRPSCLSRHGCASAHEDSRWRRHFHFVHHSLKSMAWQVFRRGMNRAGRSRSNINPQSFSVVQSHYG